MSATIGVLALLIIFIIFKLANTNADSSTVYAEIEELRETMKAEVSESGEEEAEILEVTDFIEQPLYIGRQPPVDYVEFERDVNDRHSFQIEYKDTYQSNIVIILNELLEINIDDYKWFNYNPKPTEAHYNTAQFVCYAILTYYDGNVPCDYFVNFDYGENEDAHSPQNGSMQFEVQTHGDKPLNISLDLYNYKIHVEEGVKKKNAACIFSCCANLN